MAATPPEYYVRYRRTNVSNRNNHMDNVFWALSDFAVSGNTNIAMGKITRIVFRHPHTSTQSVTWYLYGQLAFTDQTTLNSDTVSHKFSGDLYTYVNTFDTSALTVEQWQKCTGVWTCFASPTPSSGTLYYRAVSDAPVDLYVYFWAASDLVDGAEPPTVSGVTITDNSGYASTFGSIVQYRSDLTITGQYQLDPNYPFLTASHTLQLKNSGGASLYQATQNENAVFMVGAVSSSGTITWSYTVTDSAGNSVTATGTFTSLAYTLPAISSLSAERYIETLDDQGHTTYVASDDGENVWFSLRATIASMASANAWTMKLLYGDEDTPEQSGTEITVQSGSDGGTVTKTRDRSILTATISASSRWWFKFSITDELSTVSMMCYVDEASAFFDVEEFGVSVGMRSTGKNSSKKFESAYPAHFYDGVYDENGIRMDTFLKYTMKSTDLNSNFEPYEANVYPVVRRCGPVVYLNGVVSPTQDLAVTGASSTYPIMTLPTGYRPAEEVFGLMQSTATSYWLLRVGPDGVVAASRCREGSTYTNFAANFWMPFSMVWFTADVEITVDAN